MKMTWVWSVFDPYSCSIAVSIPACHVGDLDPLFRLIFLNFFPSSRHLLLGWARRSYSGWCSCLLPLNWCCTFNLLNFFLSSHGLLFGWARRSYSCWCSFLLPLNWCCTFKLLFHSLLLLHSLLTSCSLCHWRSLQPNLFLACFVLEFEGGLIELRGVIIDWAAI